MYWFLQGSHWLQNGEVIKEIVALVSHPDFDIRERALLSLIALSNRLDARKVLKSAQSQKAFEAAKKLYAGMGDELHASNSDDESEYRTILEDHLVLLSDLEDSIYGTRDEL